MLVVKYNSLNFEKLKGYKEGLYSIRINDQYRIEFTIEKMQRYCWLKFVTSLNCLNIIKDLSMRKTANEMTPFIATHPGEKPITAEIAMLFVKALNLDSPDLLLGLQMDYDKQVLMNNKSFLKRLASVAVL